MEPTNSSLPPLGDFKPLKPDVGNLRDHLVTEVPYTAPFRVKAALVSAVAFGAIALCVAAFAAYGLFGGHPPQLFTHLAKILTDKGLHGLLIGGGILGTGLVVGGSAGLFYLKRLEGKKHDLTLQGFKDIHSGTLIRTDKKFSGREEFLGDPNWHTRPPLISKSEFLPAKMTKHLMREKRDKSLFNKYLLNTAITPLEGALSTFVTPVCQIHMTGDYCYKNNAHMLAEFDSGLRQAVMSAAVQPDFERDDVMMQAICLEKEKIQGENWLTESTKIPTVEEKNDHTTRIQYDANLKKHLVHHLTANHSLPSKSEVKPIKKAVAINLLEEAIGKESFDPKFLQNQFVEIGDKIISLEMLFHVYVHQLRNELSALEALLPQGYVYTIDPPSIFATMVGGAHLLNRLQILALKSLSPEKNLKNMKVLAFNNYADNCIDLFKKVMPQEIQVMPKSELFKGPNQTYLYQNSDYALVVHNNGDGFGQNIEYERGPTSMDAVLGQNSDASKVLDRSRPDLLDHIF